MGKIYEAIAPPLIDWIQQQQMFFVSTAPLAADGHINCSPKGLDAFRILGPTTVAYLDLTGSGVETIAHLKENGRIVIMFCAFNGDPRIVRFYGQGEVMTAADAAFDELRSHFPAYAGTRAIIRIQVSRIADSCGHGVPLYEFQSHRDTLTQWAEKRGVEGMKEYHATRNHTSIDGLAGL